MTPAIKAAHEKRAKMRRSGESDSSKHNFGGHLYLTGRPCPLYEFRVEKAPDPQQEGEKVTFGFESGANNARSVTVGSAKLERINQSSNSRADE